MELQLYICSQVFTVLRAHIKIFQVIEPCSIVGRNQHFQRTHCFHLEGQSEHGEDVVWLHNRVAWMVVTQTHGRREYYAWSEPTGTVRA
jgi:hypothetical protein